MLTRCQNTQSRRAGSGFTLVEMLVAIALILLMMTMFAEIFGLATGAMSKQKGLAELDQRQRMASTLLRDDVGNRSFRTVYPYHPADTARHLFSTNRPVNIPFHERRGYFYVSENDPENDSDDVLQFTVTKTDGTVFYGRTRELLDTNDPPRGAGFNPNQPENDDGAFFGEGLGVGTSPSAEVAYFLRNGILYRRVSLLRVPVSGTTDTPTDPTDTIQLIQDGIYPQASVMPMGYPPYYVTNANASNRYPQDFDFSAINDLVGPRVIMLGALTSLDNAVNQPLSLGITANRFGFQRPTGVLAFPIGEPKEFLPNGNFIGRFTHEETSHPDFAWPGNPGWGSDGTIATSDDLNPYTRPVGLVLGPSGAVSAYAGNLIGNRQGEDILLTNVQSFDIKVWDAAANVGPNGQPGLAGINDNGLNGTDDATELGWPGSDDGAFVDVGHSGIGFYSQANNRNPNYGPLGTNNRCLDTWHVSLGGTLGLAPFRPAFPGFDQQPGRQGIDDDNSDNDNNPATGADDSIGELGWPDTDDIPVPLKAIQIRIRYLDISSGLVREVTIIEPLNTSAI